MTRLSTQHVDAPVDYYGLALQDSDDSWLPALFPEGFTRGPFMSIRTGRLDFTSAGHTQTVSVEAEVWTEAAPEPEGLWDETAMGRIECRSGELRIWSVAGGPAPQGISLPHSAVTTWRVRAKCKGREAAARACLMGVPRAVERYLLQFWPE